MRDPDEMVSRWGRTGPLRPAEDGLINQTWLVGEPPSAVLQWVNPIFSPRIQEDIAAVTAHLAVRGEETPRLLESLSGRWGEPDPEAGCWRMMTFIPGETLHRAPDIGVPREAGAMLARFHAALSDLDYTFQAPSRDIHNTPARMAELEAALAQHRQHPLYERAAVLGEGLLASWSRWRQRWGEPGLLRRRICHGDPKLSNLRFRGPAPWRAVCLLDLDTVGWGTLSAELGDAWRSWCNPAGEDDPRQATLDEDAFAAAARGYLSAAPPDMDGAERESLVPGLERICLELSARFCADALRNSYFREDRERWPAPGLHNLLRAEGQYSLAVAAQAAQARCVAIVSAVR